MGSLSAEEPQEALWWSLFCSISGDPEPAHYLSTSPFSPLIFDNSLIFASSARYHSFLPVEHPLPPFVWHSRQTTMSDEVEVAIPHDYVLGRVPLPRGPEQMSVHAMCMPTLLIRGFQPCRPQNREHDNSPSQPHWLGQSHKSSLCSHCTCGVMPQSRLAGSGGFISLVYHNSFLL